MQHIAASTYKVPLAIIGFDIGILENPQIPVITYDQSFEEDLAAEIEGVSIDLRAIWGKEVNPYLWMQKSCVWYSQQLSRKLEMQQTQDYLAKFRYGNQAITNKPNYWLPREGTLNISVEEQVEFFKRFLAKDLDVKERLCKYTCYFKGS